MSDTYIDYDAKVQDALRGVVRSVLQDTERDGLMGEHHFYIAFKTQAPGVNIPASLMSRFPDEMTIVLQHKFWGLKVYDDRFEVGLSFNQKPEHLEIPFDAVVGFVDPSVQFALQFHDEAEEIDAEELGENGESAESDIVADFAPAIAEADAPQDKTPADEAPSNADGGNVVTLDALRKK